MGHLFAHAVAKKAQKDGILDIRRGFQFFKDRRVAVGTKFGAFTIGALVTGLLVMLELPLEVILSLLMPSAFIIDGLVDGAEIILLPVIIAAAVLPHLVRRTQHV